MRLVKKAGKTIVKMSKKEWLAIGEKAGWTKQAGYGYGIDEPPFADERARRAIDPNVESDTVVEEDIDEFRNLDDEFSKYEMGDEIQYFLGSHILDGTIKTILDGPEYDGNIKYVVTPSKGKRLHIISQDEIVPENWNENVK